MILTSQNHLVTGQGLSPSLWVCVSVPVGTYYFDLFFTENAYGWCMYREYWRVWVPLLLAPRQGTTSVDTPSPREEDRITEVLIKPLEQFIAGQEDVDTVWRSLRECDAPSAVCGHVFKNGETCYNCK